MSMACRPNLDPNVFEFHDAAYFCAERKDQDLEQQQDLKVCAVGPIGYTVSPSGPRVGLQC